MSAIVADFTARFNVDVERLDGPVQGRVLVGEQQLVLAASEDEQVTVPLSSIVDVNVGAVPEVFPALPGTPVTVGFKRNGGHAAALVAADETTIESFGTVMFKTLLNETGVTVKHPAKHGGRVLATEFRDGRLALAADSVRIETSGGAVAIDLDAVIDFSRDTRVIGGRTRSVVVVDHMHAGDAITTEAATTSGRKLSLIGRLLRREYDARMAAIEDLSLSETETELLTTVYSTGGRDVSLPSVLGLDADRVKRVLNGLYDKGLVEPGEHTPVLTSRGHIVVTQYIERINS